LNIFVTVFHPNFNENPALIKAIEQYFQNAFNQLIDNLSSIVPKIRFVA